MGYTRLVEVKSNHLSLQLVVDPGGDQHVGYRTIPESMISADLPIHVDIIVVPNGRESSMIAAVFHYFLRIKGRKTVVRLFSIIRQILQYMGGGIQQVPITEQLIELALQQITANHVDGYRSAAGYSMKISRYARRIKKQRGFSKLFTNISVEAPGRDADHDKKLSLLCFLRGGVVKNVTAHLIPTAIAEQ